MEPSCFRGLGVKTKASQDGQAYRPDRLRDGNDGTLHRHTGFTHFMCCPPMTGREGMLHYLHCLRKMSRCAFVYLTKELGKASESTLLKSTYISSCLPAQDPAIYHCRPSLCQVEPGTSAVHRQGILEHGFKIWLDCVDISWREWSRKLVAISPDWFLMAEFCLSCFLLKPLIWKQ